MYQNIFYFFALQAMVLDTIAEHSLPFTLSPAITDLAKELARDPTALSALHMDHTSASYKLTHGLKKTWEDKLDVALCSTTFSLNLDETTSKTNARVLGVLVSYWSSAQKKIVVKHLAAIELISATQLKQSSKQWTTSSLRGIFPIVISSP